MDKKEQILHYHRIDGLSQREIARRVGVSRKTVKRYITEYETLAQADPEEGINMCLASEPEQNVGVGGIRFDEDTMRRLDSVPPAKGIGAIINRFMTRK